MLMGLHFLLSLLRLLLFGIMIPCSELAISIFNINLFVGDIESHPQSFMNLPRELDTKALFLKWLQVVYEAALVPNSTHTSLLSRAWVMSRSSGIPWQMGESSLLMYQQTPHTSLQLPVRSKYEGLGMAPKLEQAFFSPSQV